jgi:hypothetical protein
MADSKKLLQITFKYAHSWGIIAYANFVVQLACILTVQLRVFVEGHMAKMKQMRARSDGGYRK